MCQITTLTSGAVSFGVIAGVLSGLFYVILVGLKWIGKLRISLEEEAIRGGRRGNAFVVEGRCSKCGALIEKRKLSGLEQYCEHCACNGYLPEDKDTRQPEKDPKESANRKEDLADSKTIEIRENIEKLVEKIVGGSLDGVSLGRLSNHAAYESKIEAESPKAAHIALKSLIERVVAEAMKLPNLKEALQTRDSVDNIDVDLTKKNYEDILATAILNKVIEKSQAKKERQTRRKLKKRKELKLNNMKTRSFDQISDTGEEFPEEDNVYNSDWSDTSRSEQLSLTIEEHIEEITTTYENSDDEELGERLHISSTIPFPESGRIIRNGVSENLDDDEMDEQSSVTELISKGSSWEENWLFQRKKHRSGPNSHHPVPVPMLVPNPSQEYRALIGGVDADDLSDLSECSDSALEDVVLASDHEEKEDNADTSLTSELSSPSQKEKDVSVDYEYFQKLDIELPDTPVSMPRSADAEHSDKEEVEEPMMKEETQVLKCTIAEREKEKWKHPVFLADNPYSPENLRKRNLQGNVKNEYFRSGYNSEDSVDFPSDSRTGIAAEPVYSRDYYVKASRCPTGDPNQRPISVSSPGQWGAKSSSLENLSSLDEEEELDEGEETHRAAEETSPERKTMLPSVKELTKMFAKGIEELTTKSSHTSQQKDCKRETTTPEQGLIKDSDSEISSTSLVVNVSTTKLSPSSSVTSQTTESGNEDSGRREETKPSILISKFNGKEIHSLTARSISREFREELKNNNSPRKSKPNRTDSSESDRSKIASESARNRSPTPPIDLQSKRKFWEDIISSHANK